ncbi:MAG TPA: hypothetical protein VLG36_03420 [Candidatus Chromulinivoraceae bacterium]|nr:hypothetical protein [Candidatus Chromulinivoraceae bacterium]
MKQKAESILKNRDGRIVLWQMPNLLLWIWIVLKLLTLGASSGRLHLALEQLSNAVLFTWAYLEIAEGVTVLRKILGSVVMTLLVFGFFWQ